MSDAPALTPAEAGPNEVAPPEDRTLAAIIYALYLFGITNGLTVLIGLVLAHVNVDSAGPKMRTHHVFNIRTFWVGMVWLIIGSALFIVGVPLSLVLVGIPMVLVGMFIWGVGGVWFIARCILGAVYLFRDEPYPRPRSWLL